MLALSSTVAGNVQDLFTFQWINPFLDEVPSFLGTLQTKEILNVRAKGLRHFSLQASQNLLPNFFILSLVFFLKECCVMK